MNTSTTKRAIFIRVDRDLYARIEKLAKKERKSINNFIENALAEATHFYTPNKETIKAMEEIERREGLQSFDNANDLFESKKKED